MDSDIKQGFIKRAQELGFTAVEGEELFKQASLPKPRKAGIGHGLIEGAKGTINGALYGGLAGTLLAPGVGTAMGALGGAGIGGLAGGVKGLVNDESEKNYAIRAVRSNPHVAGHLLKAHRNAEDEAKKEKKAESSYLGRVANSIAQPAQAMLEHPTRNTLISGTSAPLGLLGITAAQAIQHRLMGNTNKERYETMENADKANSERGYGEAMHRTGKGFAKPYATIGGLAGGVAGGINAHGENVRQEYNTVDFPEGETDTKKIMDILLQSGAVAGLGALGGGALGYADGAARTAVSKAVSNMSTDETKHRARDQVAKHPYLMSLPGSSIIGSAFS